MADDAKDIANEWKYIVFNRARFLEEVGDEFYGKLIFQEIEDAVVIRRQDEFASPCLLTYSLMMSMVARNHPDPLVKKELKIIADYFHEQGVLAGEEGWKLPTL